jgi:hypothetical protein
MTAAIGHDGAILNLEINRAAIAPVAVIRVMEHKREARHPIVCDKTSQSRNFAGSVRHNCAVHCQ